jgi:hypothetical protein
LGEERSKKNIRGKSRNDHNKHLKQPKMISARRLTGLVFIAAFLALFSCHKKEEITVSKEFPGWLRIKIAGLIPDEPLCKISEVTTIQYKGKIYYHVYCGLWSCMYCQLFDEQGNRPDWKDEDWQDFFANKKELRTDPACG